MKKVEQSILDRILYIGNEIPAEVASDKRDKFVLLGYPQQVIDETINKSFKDLVIWFSEYAYKRANPKGSMDTPSIVYEQIERDLRKFLES
jgi:hypothetical protein